ncbi:MAG: ABC transporter ATP-binding protein [Myxococcaceae bacterium]|nr:MAG: ABC transporter ATP-binding protein [Myxococcaceae bacterium]
MIQVEQLSKYYGARAAIRNLSFRIDSGEVVGFLGLNGAGKTTTLRILGCVLLPTSGTVRLDGQDLLSAPRQLKARIGFLPETPPLYEDMTVGEYLAFVAGLRGVDPARIPARVGETEERTGLAAIDAERISTLSHGFRQRVGVAQALVHAPEVLLLDEPANGLDPVQNVEMRALVRSLRGDHTVLVSSHILPEIAQTCDRLLVVRDGELVAQGSEAELQERLGVGTGVELEIAGPVEAVASALRNVPGVRAVAVQMVAPDRAVLRVDAPDALRPALAQAALAAGAQLFRLDVSADRLESLFLKLTGRGASA